MSRVTKYDLFVHSQTQNTVYEIISDMSSRQDAIEERLTNLEDKMQSIQVRQRTTTQCPQHKQTDKQ